MPKFASHILFAQNAFAKEPSVFPNTHMNAFRFGAIGPDVTLFLFDPATNNPDVRNGFRVALDVLKTVRDIKDRVEAVAQKLLEPIKTLENYLTGGLSTNISYCINAGTEALLQATKLGLAVGSGNISIKNPLFSLIGNPDLPAEIAQNPIFAAQDIVISAVDNFGFPFRLFGHPYTDDGNWHQPEPTGDYSNWWWMDLLHYRRTGTFAKELIRSAAGPIQTSYARGYLTHVAGDICGHPFDSSGEFVGPYRRTGRAA